MFLLCLFLWVQRRIAKSIERIKSYSLSHSFETLKPTKTKYIHYGDIHTGKLSNITDLRMLPFIPEGDYESLQKGDLILADASEDYRGIGDICILNVENTEYNVVSGLHTIALRPKNDFPFFLYTLFKLESFKHYGYKMGTGLKVFGITYNSIGKYQFFKPSFEEQRKVSHLIVNIDHLITLQQRKVDQLNKVKKALLQQLFPEQASYIPKTRFSQFTDPWEQRKLGEMGKISRDSVSPNLYPKNEFIEYSMPAYDLGKKPQIVMGETMLSNRLKIKGDLLLINKLNVHQRRIWLVNEAKENSVSSTEFLPYSSSQINLRFLNQFLLSDRATRDLISISSGSSNSQKRIIPSDLLNYSIYVPTIKEEQSTIGNYFSNFDSLIDFHRCKLDQLKQVKKFLLQNMFI